jgi:hypothetical protein
MKMKKKKEKQQPKTLSCETAKSFLRFYYYIFFFFILILSKEEGFFFLTVYNAEDKTSLVCWYELLLLMPCALTFQIEFCMVWLLGNTLYGIR